MMTPRFYIFGTPEGFDMLDGTLQDVSYFQRYYDGSKENTKFSIHRTAQGSVSYVFLKYSLSSCNSRTGAFFGMALVFDNEFCAAPLQLYRLFDYVYQKHVLYHDDSNKGFLKAINGSEVKAQFLISRFEEQQGHIEFIEKVLLVNLKKDDILSNAFCPLGPGFKNENPNLLVKMAMDGASDEKIVNNCRNYNYVTISPEWEDVGEDDSEIAPQVVKRWKDLIPEYQRFIIQCLGDLKSVDKNEVKKYQNQTEGILLQLSNNKYNKNISPNIESDYEELRNQLADLYQKAKDVQVNTPAPTPLPIDPLPPTPTPLFRDNTKKWISDNKGKIAGIVGAVVVLVVLLVLLRPKSNTTHKEPSYCELATDSIQKKLNAGLYDDAKKIAERIPDPSCREEELSLVKKEQAEALDIEINQLINENKWKDAFDKTEGYFDENAKNTKSDELQVECVKYFNGEILNITDNNYFTESKRLEEELKAVKDYIGDQYNSLKNKINKRPAEKPKPTTAYKIEYLKVDNRGQEYINLKKSICRGKEGIRTITSSETINMSDSYAIIFCVVNQNTNGALTLTSSDIICNRATIDTKDINSGWIGVNSIENDATIEIKKAKITITLKKEQ